MAIFRLSPFSIVVMWTVISCFMEATWSTRNNYGSYLDSDEDTTDQDMTSQEHFRQISTRNQDPYHRDGRYIYDRVARESQNRNSNPAVYITDLWESRTPGDSFDRSENSFDEESNPEAMPRDNLELLSSSDLGQTMSGNIDFVGDRNGVVHLSNAKSKKNMAAKRENHSLSIVNPLEVLRQRLMLEMARRRMQESKNQIQANDVILKTLGRKRREASAEEGLAKSANTMMRKKSQNQNYLGTAQISVSENSKV